MFSNHINLPFEKKERHGQYFFQLKLNSFRLRQKPFHFGKINLACLKCKHIVECSLWRIFLKANRRKQWSSGHAAHYSQWQFWIFFLCLYIQIVNWNISVWFLRFCLPLVVNNNLGNTYTVSNFTSNWKILKCKSYAY